MISPLKHGPTATGWHLNWIIDLYGWAMKADRITSNDGVNGILIIEEIDQKPSSLNAIPTLYEFKQIIPQTPNLRHYPQSVNCPGRRIAKPDRSSP